MIVETMRFKEVRAEIDAELPELQKRATHFAPKYEKYLREKTKRIRSANQRRQYREPKAYSFTSTRKNKWTIIFDRDDLGLLNTFIVRFNSKKGPTAYMVGQPIDWNRFKTRILARFTGHFFSRYRERFGLDSDNATETITTYFKNNPRLACIPYDEIADGVARIYTPQKQGMALGFIDLNEELHVYNTFLSDAEFKGEQKNIHGNLTKEYREMLKSVELSAEEIMDIMRILENLEGEEQDF